ncbi:SDR family NAD(P)-dependent oxidoreductase [Streptomyces sp. NPDC101149]|uniref:SDR family NAD(P)-dependent oxidoreductase n=1 Tax=Streptomyces sp. NPDC101149 TaxID=3366113 RepID=UPI0038074D20
MDIKGKTALVAGGTSGLGLGVARDLAARGANVVVVGRRAELAARIAADLGNAIGVGADIADSTAVAAAIEAAVERFGGIHINVNTAGVIDTVRLVSESGEPTDVAAFTRVVDTNLVGTFNVMSQAAAVMLRNEPDADGERGVIVNTSSDAAYDGTTGMAGYSASKAALVGMTLPAAREFAGRGIRVNTIVAGGFDTPIFDGYTTGDAIAEQVALFVNPRRLGRPEEFAALAAHIVENGYFNAAAPRLDAGYRIPL